MYIFTRKMKKKILSLLLVCSMVIGLCGCGKEKNPAKKEQSITETQSVIEAYKEYYNEFYNEHYSDDIGYIDYLYQSMGLEDASYLQYDENAKWEYNTITTVDCAGKVIYLNNKPVMIIVDLIDCGPSYNLDPESDYYELDYGFLYDVYVFEFDGKQVVEKTVIPNVTASLRGLCVFTNDNKIYLYDDINSGTHNSKIYCVDGNTYSETEAYNEIDGNWILETGIGSNKCGAEGIIINQDENLVYSIIHENNYVDRDAKWSSALNGELFNDWLDYLSEQEVSSTLELDIKYGEYLVENKFQDFFEILYWQDGVYYYYYDKEVFDVINTASDAEYDESKDIDDGTLVMCGYDAYCNEVVIPEAIMGYQVSSIEKKYLYLTSFNENGNNWDITIQIPDSVAYIEPDKLNKIFCSEGSYAQQYAEEMGIPYVLGTMEENMNDEPVYPQKYIDTMTLNNYQNYIKENFGNSKAYYRLEDINQDGIQELLLSDGMDSIALCYLDENNNVQFMWLWGDIAIDSNGTIIDKGISMSFDYIPDTRLLVYNQETNTYETTHVLSLKNTDIWTDFDWTDYDYSKIKEDTRLFTYYVDDVQYATYEEANNVFNSYYAYGTQIEIKNFYDSLEEAYENIGIDEIGFYIGDIETMSYTDGVLSISDDYGVSISYSVADDCVWEFDSPFDDTLTPITYEEIENDWTEARNYYLEYGEMYWSYYEVTVVVKDNQVIRVYTSHN